MDEADFARFKELLTIGSSDRVYKKPHRRDISEEDRKNMHELYKYFDSNSNGVVELGEMLGALTKLGDPKEKPEQLESFHSADTDGSGFVDFNEFLLYIKNTGTAFGLALQDVGKKPAA